MAEEFFEWAAPLPLSPSWSLVSFSECEKTFLLTSIRNVTNQSMCGQGVPARPARISVWEMDRLSWTCRTSWVILSPDPQHPRHQEKKAKGGKYMCLYVKKAYLIWFSRGVFKLIHKKCVFKKGSKQPEIKKTPIETWVIHRQGCITDIYCRDLKLFVRTFTAGTTVFLHESSLSQSVSTY